LNKQLNKSQIKTIQLLNKDYSIKQKNN